MSSVLVIEDDDWLATQYERLLIKSGYDVKTTSSAEMAIEMIDDNLPDVIVLDVLLTGSTAFALLHELQTYADTSLIPVILCSSLAGDLSLSNLSDYGVKKVLDKTKMMPQDLIAAIKSIL